MTSTDRRIVVTGAAGYLGGRVVGSSPRPVTALVRQIVPWLADDEQVQCDLLDPSSSVVGALEGASTVVHLAGHNEVVAGSAPDRAETETVAMTERLVDAAQRAGVDRIVYVSTVHVYGTHLRPGATIDETLPPAPTSPYARARARSEDAVRGASGPDGVVLRLTNAVGAPSDPRVDRWTLVASDLSRAAVLDRRMVLRSSGAQTRDFITVDDASRLVVEATDPARVPAGVYNLAAGRSSTIRDLARLVRERTEVHCGWTPVLQAPPEEDPEEPYVVDISRLSALGLDAAQPIVEGIDELIVQCAAETDDGATPDALARSNR